MNNSILIQYHKTNIGDFVLGSYNDKLCLMDFQYRKMREVVDERIKRNLKAEFKHQQTDLLHHAAQQIDEYLADDREVFDLPLLTVGTEFQKSVWSALLTILYGETTSYAELAKLIDNNNAVRAVASANGANAIALVIPCHRVIESNGNLGGYGGGLPIKKRLLSLECKNLRLL